MTGDPTCRPWWHDKARWICQRVILKGTVRASVDVTVHGLDNIARLRGPFVMVANHSSHLDASCLVTMLPWSLTQDMSVGVASDYFYRSAWKRFLVGLFYNSYPVDRDRRDSVGSGLSLVLLRNGIPIQIFPEGTRSRDGRMGTFKPGAAALARTLRVPIVPVAIIGTHHAMPVGRRWPRPGRPPVQLLVGSPLRAGPGEGVTEFNDRVCAQLCSMLETGSTQMPPEDNRPAEPDDPQQEAR